MIDDDIDTLIASKVPFFLLVDKEKCIRNVYKGGTGDFLMILAHYVHDFRAADIPQPKHDIVHNLLRKCETAPAHPHALDMESFETAARSVFDALKAERHTVLICWQDAGQGGVKWHEHGETVQRAVLDIMEQRFGFSVL